MEACLHAVSSFNLREFLALVHTNEIVGTIARTRLCVFYRETVHLKRSIEHVTMLLFNTHPLTRTFQAYSYVVIRDGSIKAFD